MCDRVLQKSFSAGICTVSGLGLAVGFSFLEITGPISTDWTTYGLHCDGPRV